MFVCAIEAKVCIGSFATKVAGTVGFVDSDVSRDHGSAVDSSSADVKFVFGVVSLGGNGSLPDRWSSVGWWSSKFRTSVGGSIFGNAVEVTCSIGVLVADALLGAELVLGAKDFDSTCVPAVVVGRVADVFFSFPCFVICDDAFVAAVSSADDDSGCVCEGGDSVFHSVVPDVTVVELGNTSSAVEVDGWTTVRH